MQVIFSLLSRNKSVHYVTNSDYVTKKFLVKFRPKFVSAVYLGNINELFAWNQT